MTALSGNWIRQWRTRNRYTQQDLASELGVKRQTVLTWEKAPSVERMVFLSLVALESRPETRKTVTDGRQLFGEAVT